MGELIQLGNERTQCNGSKFQPRVAQVLMHMYIQSQVYHVLDQSTPGVPRSQSRREGKEIIKLTARDPSTCTPLFHHHIRRSKAAQTQSPARAIDHPIHL
jgi:hypothetical protein